MKKNKRNEVEAMTIIMQIVSFKLPTIDQVTFTIIPEEEYEDPRDYIESLNDDKEFIEGFVSSVEANKKEGPWGWCSIKVTASYKGFEGEDYLGYCSYLSEGDFKRNSGQWEQMKENAYNDLIAQLKELAD